MQIRNHWTTVTAERLKQCPAPSKGTQSRFEAIGGATVADTLDFSALRLEDHRTLRRECLNHTLGWTAATAVAAPLARTSQLALSFSVIAGTLAVGHALMGLEAHHIVGKWERFESEMQTWAKSAQV